MSAGVFSQEWHARRRDELIAQMQRKKIDCVILSNSALPVNLYYFTGFDTTPHRTLTLAFFTIDGQSALLIPALRADQAAVGCAAIHRQVRYSDDDDISAVLRCIAVSLHLRDHARIAVDESLEFFKLQILQQAFPTASFCSATALIDPLRMRKTPEELAILRTAYRMTDEVYKAALTEVHPGMTELEFRHLLEEGYYQRGFAGGLLNGVAFGKNTTYTQWVSDSTAIAAGDQAYCDLGAVWNHYWTDTTRCFSLGAPSAAYQRLYNICLQGEQLAEQAVHPGMTFDELHWITGNFFRKEGVLQYWPVRLGHGIGLLANESPSVCNGNHDIIEEGMVITIEPTLHIPGHFGLRIENTIVVTSSGCESLSQLSLELTVIPL